MLFFKLKYLAFTIILINVLDRNHKLLPHFICPCLPCPNYLVISEKLQHENWKIKKMTTKLRLCNIQINIISFNSGFMEKEIKG